MDLQTLLAFTLYFGIILAIGLAATRKQKNASDFLLGSRSLNYWITAISAQASDMSPWLFMGFPAVIYTHGIIECWVAFGLIIGNFLCWHFLAPKLRTATETYQALTLSTYFTKRYSDNLGIIRILTALISLIFFTFYISAGLRGMGTVSETCFGLDYTLAITVSTLAVIFYTAIGGFLAVAWADFFQGTFLLAMIVLVPAVAFMRLPHGMTTLMTALYSKKVTLTLFPDGAWKSIGKGVVIAASWGLGYFGQPHYLSKFMGIKDVRELGKAKIIGVSWQVIVLSAAVALGLIGIAFFPEFLADPEHVFIIMVKRLFTPFFAAFILCAILAASISTIDSQVLVFASILSEDIYKGILNKNAQSKEMLWVSRCGVLLVASLAYFIAFAQIQSIYVLVKYAWSGLASSFGPLLLISLHSRRVNFYGALSGIIIGALTAGLWPLLNMPLSEHPLIPGFILSVGAIFGVSWLTKKYYPLLSI